MCGSVCVNTIGEEISSCQECCEKIKLEHSFCLLRKLTIKANCSAEIMRSGFGARDAQRLNMFHFHGDDVILILQASFDQQELVMNDHGMILLEKSRRDDGVGDSGFVFKAEENKTFCCSGTLARDHGSSEAYMRSMRKALEFAGRAHASPF